MLQIRWSAAGELTLVCVVRREEMRLFADETTAPVLDAGRGRTKTGQLWAYAADDRPWGGSDPPGAAYVYAPDRKAERPIAHLEGFKGVLQVDGYAGYSNLVLCDGRCVNVCAFECGGVAIILISLTFMKPAYIDLVM